MDKREFSARRRIWGGTMRGLMVLCTAVTCALAVFLIVYVLVRVVPNLSWQLLSTKPSHLDGSIGILPDITTTACTVLTTLLVVLPLGVCAAVYLTEYAANKRVVAVIEYAAETLSGIPSIIYGLVGQMFFCQFLGMKKSLLAGAMTLVIMNLPTIMRTTQESLKTVPQSYREGAFGLGAGKWRTIRTVVLPGCVDGVLTGCILAVGRILGESAALLFTAGFAHALNGFFQGLRSAGLKVYVCHTPNNVQDIFKFIREIGSAVGEEAKGEAMAKNMEAQLEAVRKQALQAAGDKPLNVLALSFTGPLGMRGTFSGLCYYAGVHNVLDGMDIPYQSNLSEEKMLELNPELIITPSWDYSKKGDPEQFRQRILQNPAYKSIKAVKNGRVQSLHDNYLYSTSQYTVKAVQELAHAAYGI